MSISQYELRTGKEKVIANEEKGRRGHEKDAHFKDIPAQWAKIRQGLVIFRVIFRISSKCVCLSNGGV